jgi:hypothetical protein
MGEGGRNYTTARKPGNLIIQYSLSTLVFLLFSSSVSFYYFGYIVFLLCNTVSSFLRFRLFFVNSLLDVLLISIHDQHSFSTRKHI